MSVKSSHPWRTSMIPTRRVNAAHMPDFIGKPVVKEDKVTVITTDLKVIYIIPGEDISSLIAGQVGEIRGIVHNENTLVFYKFLLQPGLSK
ncbi:hypothetical protein K474DRAFT_1707771 [Panus rudis PR-1116 ss-1]|nr:hypothetical protein K474DRAFT_1707771 [Panus rudis PR-1116 ss-1]